MNGAPFGLAAWPFPPHGDTWPCGHLPAWAAMPAGSLHTGSHRSHPSSAVHPSSSLCSCPMSHRLEKTNSGWGAHLACFRHLSEPLLLSSNSYRPCPPGRALSALCPPTPHYMSADPPCWRSLPTCYPSRLVIAVVCTVLEQAEAQVALGAASGGHPHPVGSGEMLGGDILLIWDPVSAATTAWGQMAVPSHATIRDLKIGPRQHWDEIQDFFHRK